MQTFKKYIPYLPFTLQFFHSMYFYNMYLISLYYVCMYPVFVDYSAECYENGFFFTRNILAVIWWQDGEISA
jgi:hypothetical protein